MLAAPGRAQTGRATRATCVREVAVSWARAKHIPSAAVTQSSPHTPCAPGRRVAACAAVSTSTATTEPTLKDVHASTHAISGTQWLSQAIPHIIKALAQHKPTPFIQWCYLNGGMSQRASFEVQSISAGVQDWSAVQHKAATSGADALVLVRAVDGPSLMCSSYPVGSGSPSPDCSTCVASPAAAGSRSIMGSVDEDCCSGPASSSKANNSERALAARAQELVEADTGVEADSSSSSSRSDDEVAVAARSDVQHQKAATAPLRSRRRFQRRLHAAAQAAAARQLSPTPHAPSSNGSRAVVAYYGLVVQSARRHGLPEAAGVSHAHGGQGAGSTAMLQPLGEVDGCFLLKTVQNRDVTGCTCTHFTLTRVCHQQPLYEQLQNAWLTHS